MKKTIIALMALAGVAAAAQYDMTAADNLYAGEFTLEFTVAEGLVVSGDYDIIAAYYQVNGGAYSVNAIKLNSNGSLTMQRGGSLSSTTLDNETTLGTTNDASTFTAANGEAYTLGAGSYTLEYLGGTNGDAAAKLYLDEELVASFTGGKHNMNGAQGGGLALTLTTNDSYGAVLVPEAPAVPEPTPATLSLLALAGLAARRRRK